MSSLFGSLEDRHGVHDPDYEPPPDAEVDVSEPEDDHTLMLLEAIVALLIPLCGLGLAIWRFGRGDVGPGIADLMLGSIGFVVAFLLLI